MILLCPSSHVDDSLHTIANSMCRSTVSATSTPRCSTGRVRHQVQSLTPSWILDVPSSSVMPLAIRMIHRMHKMPRHHQCRSALMFLIAFSPLAVRLDVLGCGRQHLASRQSWQLASFGQIELPDHRGMIRLQKGPFPPGINREFVDDPVSDQIAFAASCSTTNMDVPKNRDGFIPSRVDATTRVVMVRRLLVRDHHLQFRRRMIRILVG